MEGINSSLDMIKNLRLPYLEYEVSGKECVLRPKIESISNKEMLEIIYHSIKWSITNILYAFDYNDLTNFNIKDSYELLKQELRKKGISEFELNNFNTFLKDLENIYKDYREKGISIERDEIEKERKIQLIF
ncbi:MAG: hypothetical protein QW040_03750 [Candidatus Aenigmatarchaeota archaeon]